MKARSLARPRYVYVVSEDREFGRQEGIDRFLSFFDTCDDGWVEHSPAAPVQTDWFGDCLASILFQFFNKPADSDQGYWEREREGGVTTLLRHWPSPESEKKIAFVLSIKEFQKVKFAGTDKEYVAGPWYYNLGEMKLSTHESKRHDKRWQTVPRFDGRDGISSLGTVEAAFRILTKDWSSFLDRYALFEQIRWYQITHDGWYDKSAQEYLGLPEKNADDAYRALNMFVEGCRQLDDAKRSLRCWLRNDGRDEETGAGIHLRQVRCPASV
jgi:hypothetical protein